MNVLYAVLEENPEWNVWTDEGKNLDDEPPPEFIVKVKMSGVEEPILEVLCNAYVDKYGDGGQTEREAIALTLREFFGNLVTRPPRG